MNVECPCTCHKDSGFKYIRTSMPPQPCCLCVYVGQSTTDKLSRFTGDDICILSEHKKRIDYLEKIIKEVNKQDKDGFSMQKGAIDASFERIQDLEESYQGLIKDSKWLEERIKTLEKDCAKYIDSNQFQANRQRLNLVEFRIEKLENQYKESKKPHKCPSCDGTGNDKGIQREHPEYKFCMEYASCHSCEGKGIVWG